MPSYLDRFMDAYHQAPPALGLTDIYADDSSEVLERIGAFCFLMRQSTFQNGKGGVAKVLVITPPTNSGWGFEEDAVHKEVRRAAEIKFDRELTSIEVERLESFVHVQTTANLWQQSVYELLSNVNAATAIMIVRSAAYQAADLSDVPIQTSKPTLPEDIWVRHLYKLARHCSSSAQKKFCYILLDTGEPPPFKQDNKAALEAIPKVGVFGWVRDNEPAKLVADRIGTWTSLVREGQIGAAFKDIDTLPSWMDRFKSFLKVQLIEDVAPGNELMRIIKSDGQMLQANDPKAQLRLAKIAQRSHEYEFASEMVRRSLPELTQEGDLAIAAELVYELSEDDLIDQAVARLDSLFPGSDFTADYRLRVLLRRRKFKEVFSMGADALTKVTLERRFFFQTLASELASDALVKYSLVLDTIREATPSLAGWALTICAEDAMARGQNAQAMDMLVRAKDVPKSSRVRTLMRAVRARLLERAPDGSNLVISGDELIPPIEIVVDYLSLNPEDGEVRQILTDLVSVETAGTTGLAVIVAVSAKRAEKTAVDPALQRQASTWDAAESEQHMGTLRSIFEWLSAESPIMLSGAKLPSSLIGAPADELFEIVHHAIRTNEDLREEKEANAFDSMLSVACLLAPYTSDPNEDLDIIRYAGARYRAANKPQKSRNLAEQALQLTRGDVRRRRLAWLAFSDIYLRSLSTIEAVIGFACAVTNSVAISPEQIFQEGYLQIRILRDLRFVDLAYELLAFLRDLCNDIGLEGAISKGSKPWSSNSLRRIQRFGSTPIPSASSS